MKKMILLALAVAVSAVTTAAQGAAGVIVKQRAKETRDQSNVRQGVPSPAQPGTPAAPPAPTPGQVPPNPRAQNIALLQTDLAAMIGKTAPAEVKQRFARNLLAAAPGKKPASPTVMQFVDGLAPVLTGISLEASERARLAQNLNAVFDAASIAPNRLNAIFSDVQAILQVGGARRQDALAVVGDLRAVAAEIQKAPTR